MDYLPLIGFAVFALSLLGLLAVLFLYPLTVWFASLFLKNRRATKDDESRPAVSLLIVVRNAADIIEAKIKNCLALRYPSDLLEIIFFSDGSTDATNGIIKSYENRKLRLLASRRHRGKTHALNKAAAYCTGDIIVFSDADAVLSPDALEKLTPHFQDQTIGGVCGQRLIAEKKGRLRNAQRSYIKFDSRIKLLESRIGSITSNDGKIYAIRRELFRLIAPAVTDDLYVCMSIIRQKYRFIFEPAARAYIKVPSRTPAHELRRRRRIVSRSLRGIYMAKELLNPGRYGFFAFGLFINKVMRRFLFVFMLLLLLSSIYLSFSNPLIKACLAGQILFYALAASYPLLVRYCNRIKILRKTAAGAFYFCIGNLGSFLGTVDFLSGKKIDKWDPVKTDNS